jgi:formylglycine-generating enzyme required for sulfatase activity
MARLSAFIEAVGQALCEKGRKALTGQIPYGDVLPDVARVTLGYLQKHLVSDEIRLALGEAAAAKPDAYHAQLDKMIEGLARVQSVPFRAELADYLTYLPVMVRSVFRRPSDPTGRTPPEKLEFYKPEQLLLFLPPRRPRFKVGDRVPGLDNWKLVELRGIGECSEVWVGEDPAQPEHSPAALKFAIDPESRDRIKASQNLFVAAFELNDINGVVPLRSVYVETDPPCLESAFVYGYDLTGLMHEWKWRFDVPKPEAALKLLRRVAEIVGKAHAKRMVHRDLKPSNVLIHPTEGGKFTLWVTDFGWGQIEAVRSIELARGGTPRGEQTRLAYHGAYTPLYASPQQQKKEPPDFRDDVHALGVIWFQLLKRDPHAAAPVGSEWAEEFYPHGFTPSQMKLLTACLATRPEKRPADAAALYELLTDEAATVPLGAKVADDGSRLISLKSQSSAAHAPLSSRPGSSGYTPVGTPKPPSGTGHTPLSITSRGKEVVQDAAARAAASLLGGGSGVARGGVAPGGGGSSAAGPGGMPKLVRNVIGMTFAHVPAGTFQMGSPDGEPGRRPDEGPQHLVRITRPFYLAIFPVTQSQYEKVMGKDPAFFKAGHAHAGGDLPVESVTWYDAERFCQRLGRLGDEEVLGRHYRLPTEAEWEYACRAGSATAFGPGEKLTGKDALFADAGAKGQGKTCPAGQHPANPLGLYDLHGNVFEWVADWYDEYYYFDSPGNDPHGPGTGELKVVRGGSWASPAADCRSAARKAQHPDRPANTIGFRVVLVVDGK